MSSSCSSTGSIISSAINNGQPLSIRAEKHGDAWTDPLDFYVADVKKNGEAYELHVTKGSEMGIYKLPSNKLSLLSQMENSLKDLHYLDQLSYHLITIRSGKRKKSYKINTDIMKDFIGGLKK